MFAAKSNKTSIHSTATMSANKDYRNYIEEENATHQVVIWSKSHCPYCRATKQLFHSIPNIEVKVIEVDIEPNGYIIQQELMKLTGQRTVPNVFVNNVHVGGNSDVQMAYQNGNLMKTLAVAVSQKD